MVTVWEMYVRPPAVVTWNGAVITPASASKHRPGNGVDVGPPGVLVAVLVRVDVLVAVLVRVFVDVLVAP